MDIVDAEWRDLPLEPPAGDRKVPEAVRSRARLAQSTALRDMTSSWRRHGRVVSEPAPRLQLVGGERYIDPLWLASCGGNRLERARAAEVVALNDFIHRPPSPHPPLRSI